MEVSHYCEVGPQRCNLLTRRLLQVFVRSVYRYCISVTTPFMASSCITPIPRETTRAGRLHASGLIVQGQSDERLATWVMILTFVMLLAHHSAQSLLKQDYKDDITLEDAKALALKIMSKTMDSTKLGSEKREFLLQSFSIDSRYRD